MESFDVIVLGTGAAGLTAAVSAAGHGASVLVLEKADVVGGTSAMSGGTVWIPLNEQMAEFGITDSKEEVLTYLSSMSHGKIPMDVAGAMIDAGPEMVAWLADNSEVVFELVERFPDYHPEHPGAKPQGGRSIECPLFPFDELGDWAARMSTSRQMAPNVVLNETTLGRGTVGGIAPEELARRKLHDERGCGQALMGRLLKSCLDRGIEPRLGHRAVELVLRDGRVAGVTVETPDGVVEIEAVQGVVLATGGFEWNEEYVTAYLRGPLPRMVSIETNTGDGLKMAMKAGASLGNMSEAWWTSVIDVPDENGEVFSWMVNRERIRPHTIMVNRAGRRFANEASNYNAFGAAFHLLDPVSFDYPNMPAWLLFDQEYLDRGAIYTFTADTPEVPSWLTSAPTLRELAGTLGIDADGLEEAVARWNDGAANLDDPEWGRGRSINDTHWGDGTPGPGATIGPVDTPPYYAVEVRPGALGTKGGPRTTTEGQVIDLDGNPIPGLYAAGNVMASPMGMTYGGGGGTLGPAMVFGFLSGRHAATTSAKENS